MGTEISKREAYQTLQALGLDFGEADTDIFDAQRSGIANTRLGEQVLYNSTTGLFTIEVSRI